MATVFERSIRNFQDIKLTLLTKRTPGILDFDDQSQVNFVTSELRTMQLSGESAGFLAVQYVAARLEPLRRSLFAPHGDGLRLVAATALKAR